MIEEWTAPSRPPPAPAWRSGTPAPDHGPLARPRPVVRGKFLYAGNEKLYLRGVTYGTFHPGDTGEGYDREQVERDFRQMAVAGIDSVRVYTVPPLWLLDAALESGLRVLVGLPWEQHITFLDDRATARAIVARVRQMVRACAGHPAILGFAIGNEIPASIVRWHGARAVEDFLRRLTRAVRREDPGALVTYVNYPSTEYLHLDFVDFWSFNVYLESPDRLAAYLARLQNLAGDRPLVMAEIGLDSRRNGLDAQAEALDWQIQSVFRAGCAGAFVFAWTDEWNVAGTDIEDWDFGLVDRDRVAKPALPAVAAAFRRVPIARCSDWPKVSIVVCSYNGSRTIADCLDGLRRLAYPDYETIVIDDGSTDTLADIVRQFDVRIIRTANQGLGAARNEGLRAATGEIIAYIDDDARPDPEWLAYLADMYRRTGYVAIGGPNIAPAGDGRIAATVAHAPGGPVHVLIDDVEADHLPGCNLTIRKAALEAIGGFDPRYRAAGDDVDVCWRLQDNGGRLGFHPGAMVWHHRRNSVRAYWKQQQGYGKAEALLERKWPERYNALGHLRWSGRLYGHGLTRSLAPGWGRIYGGVWGSAPFQRLYEPTPSHLASLPLMPEWWLLVLALTGLALLGLSWSPLLWFWPAVTLAVLAPVAQAVRSAAREPVVPFGASRFESLRLRALVAVLHLIQPVARLRGRIRWGLAPWRLNRPWRFGSPFPSTTSVPGDDRLSAEVTLNALADRLRANARSVNPGGDFDAWDLRVRVGVMGHADVRLVTVAYGDVYQQLQVRIVPKPALPAVVALVAAGMLAIWAVSDLAWIAAMGLGLVTVILVLRWWLETGMGSVAVAEALALLGNPLDSGRSPRSDQRDG